MCFCTLVFLKWFSWHRPFKCQRGFLDFKNLRENVPKTAWKHKNVKRAWNIDFPHLSLRDIPWWVDKRGIFRSTFVFQKICKNCTRCWPLQLWRTIVHRVSTQELRSWNVRKQLRSSSFIYSYERHRQIISAENQHFSSKFEFTATV